MLDTIDEKADPRAEILRRLTELTGRFADRAATYDAETRFPAEDFTDLTSAGLIAPTVPTEYGGLGVGPWRRDALTLWLMTAELAKADLSLARCWEGHANALLLLDALGTDEQKERWFDGVMRHGETWVVWSGEPRAPKPGERRAAGTTVERTDGGWVVNGSKVFATSAGGARKAILLVNPAGPGGAREAGAAAGTVQMIACDLSDPSVGVDEAWWDPIGMRATVSHRVTFDNTFLPDADVIGEPGSYQRDGWQRMFVPHYAASFFGAASAAYDYAIEYVTKQGKGEDPYVRQRIGAMTCDLDTAELWLTHVASLWDAGHTATAAMAGSQARHIIEHLAEQTVHHCVRACGARALVRPSPVERILRDLTFYIRHDNDDHLLATIGRAALGDTADLSFFAP